MLIFNKLASGRKYGREKNKRTAAHIYGRKYGRK